MNQYRLVWERDENCQSPIARNAFNTDIRPEIVVADRYEFDYTSDENRFKVLRFYRGDDVYMTLHWCPIVVENMTNDNPDVQE